MEIWKLENSESLYEAIMPRNPCSTLTPRYHYPPLQSLKLWYCGSSFRSLHMDLFPNLKTLKIESNDYFEAISVSDGKSLEELTFLSIHNCDSFVFFPNGGLIAPKVSDLEFTNCPKLKWLPEKMSSLSTLKSLRIRYCPLIECRLDKRSFESFYLLVYLSLDGNAPGAVANRVALEACVQARNEGRDLAREGNEIIREACKWSPELSVLER
ncbi:hypothetical protein G4B88_016046 [Cannabis sativa]|uniref:Uncharacterized protein n=2 Tax=Cannabis sativa TaxID=3483 RepID=A0A7J6DIZ8_CANSA|nr:hypothetical protein G4B88_016046 [Cannabis sativa]